ncbi:hypothetical protein JXL83_04725 [candidate division WOR-3 bacterium]|nr:hypothetical protein [candidate division WOR-3 bacterium]
MPIKVTLNEKDIEFSGDELALLIEILKNLEADKTIAQEKFKDVKNFVKSVLKAVDKIHFNLKRGDRLVISGDEIFTGLFRSLSTLYLRKEIFEKFNIRIEKISEKICSHIYLYGNSEYEMDEAKKLHEKHWGRLDISEIGENRSAPQKQTND